MTKRLLEKKVRKSNVMRSVNKQKRNSAIKKIRGKFGYSCQHEVLLFVSNKNIYAQIVDLSNGNTLCAVSTLAFKNKGNSRNIENATKLGIDLAKKCNELKIKQPSFNRAEKIFHGVVKAVADSFYSNI